MNSTFYSTIVWNEKTSSDYMERYGDSDDDTTNMRIGTVLYTVPH